VGRTLTLRLAPFEREALEAYEASERVPPERVVHTAVLYYLRQQDLKRATWPVPELRRHQPDREVQLEVEINDDIAQALEEQAAAQGVDPEPFARHVLLFFLADVDSGDVARALDRALRDE
jgi:hypothetical protein